MKQMKQLTKSFSYFLFFIVISVYSQSSTEISKEKKDKIREYIQHIQKRHEIPGVALAIIKDGETIYKKNFGKANIEHQSPIIEESIFRVYSLTKPIVSVAVFQLIEQNKLSLEDRVTKYIDSLPTSWKETKIKHLLTHSSGLPDMAPYNRMSDLTETEAKELVFGEEKTAVLGEKYQYNQTNFWLLQLIIEKVSGEKIEDFILENQFQNERKKVFFSSNSKKIIPNRVSAYFPFETGTIQISHPKLKGRYMFAANGLNITLDEFLKWNKRLRNNELLKEETRAKMWETFTYTKSNKVFAYGWDKRIINGHDSFGFSGSLITAYRTFPVDDVSVVFLSNGLGNYYNIENIINHLVSLVEDDIIDYQNLAFETFSKAVIEGNEKNLHQQFTSLKKLKESNYMNLERAMNDVGYQLINQKRIEKAVQIFSFNTKKHPSSANAFDSLGEVYLMLSDFDLAEKNYEKSIALGGTNGNAKKMLEQIKQIKKN